MSFDFSRLKTPSISPEGLKVLEMVSSDEVNINELIETITKDSTLSATLIKYANAPMYRRHIEVTNVRNALHLLGLKNVRMAVVVATMRSKAYTLIPPNAAVDIAWEHSLGVSMLAKMIAKLCCKRLADDIELITLIHDIGIQMLATTFPDNYDQITEQCTKEASTPLAEREQAMFGVTHAEVTLKMSESFRLPDTSAAVLQHFYQGGEICSIDNDIDRQCSILSLAHQIDTAMRQETPWLKEQCATSTEMLLSCLGLSHDQYENLIEDYEVLLNESFEF